MPKHVIRMAPAVPGSSPDRATDMALTQRLPATFPRRTFARDGRRVTKYNQIYRCGGASYRPD